MRRALGGHGREMQGGGEVTRVTIDDIDVMCVVADGGPVGGPAAFAALEAPLTTLRGRRFYATNRGGEYRACVAVQPGGDPEALGLSPWRIPGGEYERRRVAGWQDQVDSIGATFDGMVPAAEVDGSRPSSTAARASSSSCNRSCDGVPPNRRIEPARRSAGLDTSDRRDRRSSTIRRPGRWCGGQMRRYDHIGIPTGVPRAGEVYLERYDLHCTDHEGNPFGIQWMRYGPGCPLPDLVKSTAHVAFEVDDLAAELAGREVIIEPNSPSDGVLVAFVLEDGAPVELMQFDESFRR